jgi:hypothetical protein
MKRAITILFFLAVPFMLTAQQRKLHQVTLAAESLRVAMIDGNANLLLKLTTSDLSYGHSGGHIDTQEEFVEKFRSGKSDFVSIDIKNQQIRLYNKMATLRHELSAITNDNGKAATVKLLVLQVWVFKNGSWKMASRQAVKQT